MSQEETRINEEEVMQSLSSSSSSFLEEVVKNCDLEEITKIPRRRLNKKWVCNSLLDDDEDNTEPTVNVKDKVRKKRKRKNNDESGLEKEMWDSLTNNSKDGGENVKERKKKEETEYDSEVEKQFTLRKKKSKKERDEEEIAMKVERVIATLEIAVEDDVQLNKQGKPAINKLMRLPLLNEALAKKQLQGDFLDHGVLCLLKNWLEPLPDGSLPNITIRSAVLNILNDLSIGLDQDCRREQLKESGLGKVIMFLAHSDEETTPNRRLASDLVNKWSRIIYEKSTRYEDMLSPEEKEEHRKVLSRRQIKTAPKVSKPRPDFDTDIDLSTQPECKLAAPRGVGRARVPQVMSMDFAIRPESKFDKKLKARVKWQMDDSYIHENIMERLKRQKMQRRKGMQAFKPSVNGR